MRSLRVPGATRRTGRVGRTVPLVAVVALVALVLGGALVVDRTDRRVVSPGAEALAVGGGFVGITPVRALDTRTTGPCVGAAGRTLTIAGSFGVPADAAAVALNVTVVGPGGFGYLAVWPNGEAQPPTSALNFTPGQIVANTVTIGLGTGGAVRIMTSNGCPNVVVDVTGYFTGGTPGPGGFVGLTPTRVLDTGTTPPCLGSTGRTVALAGQYGIPGDASAVVLNLTVDGAGVAGFARAWPTGEAMPLAANVNYAAGETLANQVQVKLGAGGAVQLFSSAGCPRAIVDVLGYFVGGVPGAGGFVAISPTRVLDSRFGGICLGSGGGAVPFAGFFGVPTDAAAVAVNVTAVLPTGPGFLTVWPGATARPVASTLNFVTGQVVSNLVSVRIGSDGTVSGYTNNGCPNLVIDLYGYYRP
jgi:hypothetical protein